MSNIKSSSVSRGYSEPQNMIDERTNRLKEELYFARKTIIRLMPEEIQSLLENYYSCTSRSDANAWERDTIEKIIECANILPPQHGSYFSERAYCPLCGNGSDDGYVSGFKIPEGLRRHLLGWGNARQCNVMHATWRLAADYWNSKFREAELKENIENAKRLAERHRTETHYRIAPNITPGLIDEYSRSQRNPSEIDWAEQRLADLGFQNTCENNVKSYTRGYDDFVVYADPRENGKISFRVYKKLIPKKGHQLLFNMFYLFDNWKNDIRGKYESRLQKIVSNDKVSA